MSKAEKGLEPVAWAYPDALYRLPKEGWVTVHSTKLEGMLPLCHCAHPPMQRGWPLSADVINRAGILASDMPHTVVEKLKDAHPPTQVEPVASKSVEDCMRLADEYAYEAGADRDAPRGRPALQAAIVAYGDAQWNDAIEAALDAYYDYEQDGEQDNTDQAIRALKREPR